LLWKYFIALGKLHIIAGAPGEGKTTILLSFIAAISSGGMFPDGTKAPIGNCIIWTNEDGTPPVAHRRKRFDRPSAAGP
jgi:putative DNA primase/helicase